MAYSMARVAELTSGEWALVTGAAGPLGYSVAQVAKRLGAKVIVAASTERRVAVALTSGADTGISYGDGDLTEAVMRVTEGRGVDVVFENIGDPATWPAAFSSMAVYGRLVTVAAHGGGVVPLDTRLLYNNRLTVKGGLGDIRPGDTSEALRLATEGVYHTLIDRIMPLADAVLAHRMVEDRQVQGKLVLDPTLM
jgi:NADPH:quinone reductase-like Zn-dependent oxidoreductase